MDTQVLEFMQDILPMLEAHEGVYKYSWFMNRLEIFEWAIFVIDKRALESIRVSWRG